MFLKTTGFKRLIKEAYKGAGLIIGSTETAIYLSSGWWVIWIRKGQIPKEKLAAIIELTGELPETGEAYRVTKDGQQYELAWTDLYDVMGNAMNCEYEMEITRVIIEGKGDSDSRVLQHVGTGCIQLINERLIQMISNKEVDEKKGHTEVIGPVCGRLQGVFWYNNVMALHVMPRIDDAAMRLIKFLEGIDINEESKENWPDVSENTVKEETEEA